MIAAQAIRAAYKREIIPARVRWWLAAEGMRDWYRVLARGLEPHLGDRTKPVLSEMAAHTFERRWSAMNREKGRDCALLMSALYRRPSWIFDALGGGPKNAREHLRARMLLSRMSPTQRWEEVTVHLGELLIVLTEKLELAHGRKIIGDICFAMGERFAKYAKKTFGIDDRDPASAAIEVLRMSEYVFRVNPEHWHQATETSGWLEGTACPWFDRPGWNGAHCGIFGQFQSGVSSSFGLRYHLSKTIPKHGGTTCRVDLKPIQIRTK